MPHKFSSYYRFKKLTEELLDETIHPQGAPWSRLKKFVHFWVLVWRSFVRNRCPVRASALAYASLLALIPMLVVVASITSTFLKQKGEEQIDQFIVRMVSRLTPPAMLSTNQLAGTNIVIQPWEYEFYGFEAPESSGEETNHTFVLTTQDTNAVALPRFAQDEEAVAARRIAARKVNEFIQNTRSGSMGVTGTVLLIFVGIMMLSRVEDTFNDIWGVALGRSWFTRVFVYWGVITLAPILLITAVGLASGPHFAATKEFLTLMPFIGTLLFQLLPVVLLCLTFSTFYILIPNTKVDWRAALVGGLVGGVVFHVNSMMSVLYVSQVVSNSRIYGSLGLVPVFMAGLYLGWLILLFGAQVAYAFQNRATYFEEKQVENINQRGREFVALRLMTAVGQRFASGESPAGIAEMAQTLCVPTRLIQQLMQTLCKARLVVQVNGEELGYLPARPLETITCYDILNALRASQGHELATREEPSRLEVYGEFTRIQEAERQVASAVNLMALVNRAARAQLSDPDHLAHLSGEPEKTKPA